MYKALKRLFKIHNPKERIRFVLLFFMMLLGAVLDVVGVGAIPTFILSMSDPQKIYNNRYGKILVDTLNISSDKSLLIWTSSILISYFIFKNIYLTYLNHTKFRFIKARQINLSRTLFSLYMRAPYTYHLNKNSSELLRNISIEVDSIYSSVLMPFLGLLMEITMIVGILILLFSVEPIISLITIGIFSITSFIFLNYTDKRIKVFGKKALKARKDMIFKINAGLGGLKEIKVLNREQYFINEYTNSAKENAVYVQHKSFISFLSKPYIEIIAILSLLSITLLLIMQGREMTSVIPILVLFGSATIRLMPSIKSLVNDFTSMKYYFTSIDAIFDDVQFLRESVKIDNKLESNKDISFEKNIEIKNLSYSYPGSENPALKNININISKGEVVGLVGTSGAGKTSMADVLLGLLVPQKGEIVVDGQFKMNSKQIKYLNIGYIPQHIYLADNSIKNNIAFGIEESLIDKEKLENAINMAQLTDFVEGLPEKHETIIGENGVRLSGGQRQRIGIARALYNNPDLLIMDEATAALDNTTEKLFVQSIEKLRGKITMIIIAHRLTTVKRCDKLYLMKHGEIAASGTFDELLEKDKDFVEMANA